MKNKLHSRMKKMLISYYYLEREKKRLNAALPAGVTEKDVQFFSHAQDRAKV